jgi:hypothetical protein
MAGQPQDRWRRNPPPQWALQPSPEVTVVGPQIAAHA